MTTTPVAKSARRVATLAAALRSAGLPVGTGQVLTCQRATVLLGHDVMARYWAGRTTLVTDPGHLPTYDQVFWSLAAAGGDDRPHRPEVPPDTPAEVAASDRTAARGAPGDRVAAGAVATERERLRRRRFDEVTPAELAVIGQLLERLDLALPSHTSRRTQPGRVGDLDLPRTLERALASDGELVEHAWRARRRRRRRLVVLLDVSGSMAAHARALLRLGVAARRGAKREPSRRVEVFAFGTRLTRLSDELAARDPDAAIAAAARKVVDWDGGTRIGESIDQLVRVWGPRGVLRGSVLVVCSDGLERGDPVLLAAAMARLRRHVFRIVWVNPLVGDPRYVPAQRGMAAALPHVDLLLPGHDLASLESLTHALAALR